MISSCITELFMESSNLNRKQHISTKQFSNITSPYFIDYKTNIFSLSPNIPYLICVYNLVENWYDIVNIKYIEGGFYDYQYGR